MHRFGATRPFGLPNWALIGIALVCFALVAMLVILAAGVALVAVPALLGVAWLARRFPGLARARMPARAAAQEAAWTQRPPSPRAAPVVIEATYEDVTGRRR